MNTVLPYILYRKKLKMFFIFIYYNTRVRAKIRIYDIVYKIKENLKVNIKNHEYTLDELFDNENLENYKNGYILIDRKSVV